MKMRLALIVLLIASGTKGDTDHRFQAYQCEGEALTEAKFYRHEDCEVNSGHLKEKEYFIVGDNSKYNISGARCVISKTVRTGYCGHYSSGKIK